MKIKLFFLLLATLALQSFTASAREIYAMTWRGYSYVTNGVGGILAKPYTERDIIKKCAADNGVTNLNLLVYAYVVGERNTEVVWAATGGTVCEIFQLEYNWNDVSTTNATRTIRQAAVFNEAHDRNILGSTFGTELMRRDKDGNLVSYSYYGNFQFAIPEDGTIFQGNFTTGRRIKDTANPGSL